MQERFTPAGGYSTSGPYECAHRRLTRNPELMRYLHAVRSSTGKPIARLVFEACAERFAPDLASRYVVDPSFLSARYTRVSQEYFQRVMLRIRGIRTETKQRLGELVEEACVWWIDRNVASIKADGSAMLGSEIEDAWRRADDIFFQHPEFDNGFRNMRLVPDAPPPAGFATWLDCTPAQRARAIKQYGPAPQTPPVDRSNPFVVD